MVDFSKAPCIYWSDIAKISYLQRRIIVYSIMYYEYDESCVSDKEYDSISHQLMELKNKISEEEYKKTTYYYAMHDFDGSTGFDVPSRLTKKDKDHIICIVRTVYEQWRAKSNKEIFK